MTVSNVLGCGFLEKVYENALVVELRRSGLRIQQQPALTVHYKDVVVGEYSPDLLVESAVLVELKASRSIEGVHQAQCINYLKAANLNLCLLLNFARPSLEVRRIVWG